MAKGNDGYKLRTITCERCSAQVTRRMPAGRRFCSLACYRSGPRPRRRTGDTRTCSWCNATFYVTLGRVEQGEGQFCSLACHNARQGIGKTDHVCKTCGRAFRWSPSRTASGNYRVTYCSIACRSADAEWNAARMATLAKQQRGRTTPTETAGYALLDSLGIEYTRQAIFGGKFIPDAVIPGARLAVQFDGDYWHDRKGNSTETRIRRRVALDRSQDAYVRASGWEVVRLWDSDLRGDPARCAEVLSQAIHRPRSDAPSRNPLAPA